MKSSSTLKFYYSIILSLYIALMGSYFDKLSMLFLALPILLFVYKCRIITLYTKWIIAFLGFAYMSYFWAEYRNHTRDFIGTYSYVAISLLVLHLYISNYKEGIQSTMKVLTFAPLLLFLRLIAIYGLTSFRDSSVLNDASNAFNGEGFAASIGIVFCCYFYKDFRNRIYPYALIGIYSLFIILTGSRKAVLIPILIIILYNFIISRNKADLIKKVITIISAVVIAFLIITKIQFLNDIMGERVMNLFLSLSGTTQEEDISYLTRQRLIADGLDWFSDSPVIGYGLDGFRKLTESKWGGYGFVGCADNNYVELMVDLGLVGLLLYYFIYLGVMLQLYKIWKNDNEKISALYLSIMIALLVKEYGSISYYNLYTQIIICIISSYVIIYKKDSTRKRVSKIQFYGH